MSPDPTSRALRSRRRLAALAIPALLVGCAATGTPGGSDGQSAGESAGESAGDSAEAIGASLTQIELIDLLANGPSLDGSGNNLDDPTLGQAGSDLSA